jgi:hypothetical protein
MVYHIIEYVSKCGLRDNCNDVHLTLKDSWASKVVSGIPIIRGRVTAVNAYKRTTEALDCDSCASEEYVCSYKIEIELSEQFLPNPDLSTPGFTVYYTPTSSDVDGAEEYRSTINKLLRF